MEENHGKNEPMEEDQGKKDPEEKEEKPTNEEPVKKNRFENWMSVYLPLAWSAQLGNGVVQTITGTSKTRNHRYHKNVV
jgi:hypothetical protein